MAQTRNVVCLQSKLCVLWSDFHLSMSKDLDCSWNWCTSPDVDGSRCEWKVVGIIVAVVFTQSSLVLCNPLDYSPPVSFVHQILQARILEPVAIFFSRGYSLLRGRTCVSCIPYIGRMILYHCAIYVGIIARC